MTKPERAQKLYKLISDLVEGRIAPSSFCRDFEITFNNESAPEDFTDFDWDVFSKLYDVVSWYSPFPEERRTIPNYVDEQTVATAATKAAEELGLLRER